MPSLDLNVGGTRISLNKSGSINSNKSFATHTPNIEKNQSSLFNCGGNVSFEKEQVAEKIKPTILNKICYF